MPTIKKHSDTKPRFFEVDLSDVPELDRADLEILGEEIIDFIIERTLSGKDVEGKRFIAYAKGKKGQTSYAEREGKDNPPDLNLTSDMLDSLEVIKVLPRAKRVQIGYNTGYDGLGKVEGNIKGTYGKKNPETKRPRDFLGIRESDLHRLLRDGAWL